MNSTNAIEKALQERVNAECREIVNDFISDLDKIKKKYGGSMFYYITESNASDARSFMVDGSQKVANVLQRMILENHGEAMLQQKSQELLNKLDLV